MGSTSNYLLVVEADDSPYPKHSNHQGGESSDNHNTSHRCREKQKNINLLFIRYSTNPMTKGMSARTHALILPSAGVTFDFPAQLIPLPEGCGDTLVDFR